MDVFHNYFYYRLIYYLQVALKRAPGMLEIVNV